MMAKDIVGDLKVVEDYDQQKMLLCVTRYLNGTLFAAVVDTSEGPFASIMQSALESAQLAAQLALDERRARPRAASSDVAGHPAMMLARMDKEPTVGAQKMRDRETHRASQHAKGKTRSKHGNSKARSRSGSRSAARFRARSRSRSRSSRPRSRSRSRSNKGMGLQPKAGISKTRPKFNLRPQCVKELAAKVRDLKTALVAMTGRAVLPKIAAVRAACAWKLGAIGDRFNNIFNGKRFDIFPNAQLPASVEV